MTKVRFVDYQSATGVQRLSFIFDSILHPHLESWLEFDEALAKIHPDAAVFWDRDVTRSIEDLIYVRNACDHYLGAVKVRHARFYVFHPDLRWELIQWEGEE